MADPTLSPRARLVVALLLAFAIAALQKLAVMPLVVLLTCGMVLASGQRGDVLNRMRAPALLALSLMLVLPLISGQTVLAQFGPVAIRLEGAQTAALMALRLLCIVALTLVLLSPLSPFQLVEGLRALRVPALMSDIALLTLRYLDEVGDELRRARLARQLRGGGMGWRALPDHAALIATGLIRAQARADRLWAAMRLRGYGTGHIVHENALNARDRAAIVAALLVAGALIWMDRMA